ncbi:MAG: 4-hydroxy-tetrahydrodipicolinate synthase [Verrucomicrobiota bacterium]
MSKSLKGTFTALVTPFRDGLVDADAFTSLIEDQIAAGLEGIVPVGTTGESPTLNHEEHLRVIELAIKRTAGRCLVIAGTGSNSTREAIEYTQGAQELGADAALLAAPYYNKPSQEGLYRHYMAIAESVDIPLVLYSIPGRCAVEISVETTARLARDAENIVAIKEAGGSAERVRQLKPAVPEDFIILSGDDGLTVPFMKLGAEGLISVASNLIPSEIKAMVDAGLKSDFETADQIATRHHDLFRDLFIETNPVPIKTALAAKDMMTNEVRLPLCELSDKNRETLLRTLGAGGYL